MCLTLNRDYVVRHLGVAALFLALGGWFFYDGAVRYPAMDDATLAETLHKPRLTAEDRATAIGRQYQFAGLLGFAALWVVFGVWRAKRATLTWDETSMCGTLTGGKPLAFAEVASVDDAKWEKKALATVTARDGRHFTLDGWHHAGAAELYAKLKGKN